MYGHVSPCFSLWKPSSLGVQILKLGTPPCWEPAGRAWLCLNCVPVYSISPHTLPLQGFEKHLPLLSSFQQIRLQLGCMPYLPLQVSGGEFNQVSGVRLALVL